MPHPRGVSSIVDAGIHDLAVEPEKLLWRDPVVGFAEEWDEQFVGDDLNDRLLRGLLPLAGGGGAIQVDVQMPRRELHCPALKRPGTPPPATPASPPSIAAVESRRLSSQSGLSRSGPLRCPGRDECRNAKTDVEESGEKSWHEPLGCHCLVSVFARQPRAASDCALRRAGSIGGDVMHHGWHSSK